MKFMDMQKINYDVIVVGTGAAGYSAACRIKQEGKKTVAIVTEKVNFGTSRNTGSDKQTYYKLGLGGENLDSVRTMAKDLFVGGSVDGDNALCEAALSTRCFLKLCELGVPFPVNRYGEYVGYKTDHDPYARATSAGPLTSKMMTECLEKWAGQLGVPIFDELMAIEIIKNSNGVCGLLCMDRTDGRFVVFQCSDLVLATGGPAGIYEDSVYPACHMGATGLAIDAGASLQNVTEWQYGLASVKPRWNVSGTYMQVLPRFVSIDKTGVEREFLLDFFSDPYEALSMVFLKGYQWPFDSRKVHNGSSVIDLLVYQECVHKNRTVFLDYQKNPFGLEEIQYEKLSAEAHEYLRKANACFGTPFERLRKMNRPAIDLYHSKGVDLSNTYLQIALCAQHNNGGIAVDMWWQTDVQGLYAVGECAGTHGISRPGGSALNAGQVGALRAAQHISSKPSQELKDLEFQELAKQIQSKHERICSGVLLNDANVDEILHRVRRRMSDVGAAIRNPIAIHGAIREIQQEAATLESSVGISSMKQMYKLYLLRDHLLVQEMMLRAMLDYSKVIRGTRGSALYSDAEGVLRQGLDEQFRFSLDVTESHKMIQQIRKYKDSYEIIWRPVRPIPEEQDFFENIWRQYRLNKNIY